MIVYVENTEDLQKKKRKKERLLDLVSKFSKLSRYKVNVQISVVFLYSSTEKLHVKMFKVLFKKASKNKLEINLTNLYVKSNKICMLRL